MSLRLRRKAWKNLSLHSLSVQPFYADAQTVEVMDCPMVVDHGTAITVYNQSLHQSRIIQVRSEVGGGLPACFAKYNGIYMFGANSGHIFYGAPQGLTIYERDARSVQAHDNAPVAQILSLSGSEFVSQGGDNSIAFFRIEGGNLVELNKLGPIDDKVVDAKKVSFATYVLLVSNKLLLYELGRRKDYELSASGLAITVTSDNKIVCLLNDGRVETVALSLTSVGFEFDDISMIAGRERQNIVAGCFWDTDDRRIAVLESTDVIIMNHNGYEVDRQALSTNRVWVNLFPGISPLRHVLMKGRTDGNTFLIEFGPNPDRMMLVEYAFEIIDDLSDSSDSSREERPMAAPAPPVSSAAGGGRSAPKRSAPAGDFHSVKAKILREMTKLSKKERETLVDELQKEQCSVCLSKYNRTVVKDDEGRVVEEDKDEITAVIGECNHTLCEECEKRWTETARRKGKAPTCPTCRKPWRRAEFALLLV